MRLIRFIGSLTFPLVWDGYALDGVSLPEDELAPYIQQAIDQINFVVGDPSQSAPGNYSCLDSCLGLRDSINCLSAALRASLGRKEPFALKYVEIGNEGSSPISHVS
jgi:alpha-L-arabinofuranosidase